MNETDIATQSPNLNEADNGAEISNPNQTLKMNESASPILPKNVIIYILRILCKMSDTDCKKSRLVAKYTAYDYVIFSEMKARFNKFVKHDLDSNKITLDIPNFVLPSDENIKSRVVNGLFDDQKHFDSEVLAKHINSPAGPSNKFKTMLSTLYPQTDFFMLSNPHSLKPNLEVLNLNKWEIFNYPIINVCKGFPITNMYLLMALEDPIPRAGSIVNMLRLMIDPEHITIYSFAVTRCLYGKDVPGTTKYSLNKTIEIIEGLYFEDRIPETVILVCFDRHVTIKPTRRYLYLGMLRNEFMVSFEIIIPSGVKVKFLAWAVTNRDRFNETSYESIFYDPANSNKIRVLLSERGLKFEQEPIKS